MKEPHGNRARQGRDPAGRLEMLRCGDSMRPETRVDAYERAPMSAAACVDVSDDRGTHVARFTIMTP